MWEFLETKLFWITAVSLAVYLYFKYYVLNYWQRHGVPCEPPSVLLGNIPFTYFLRKISIANFIKENYTKFSKHPFHGFYTFHKPAIVINDPELIKTILVKEFQYFHDRGWFSNDKIDVLSGHLFLLPGQKWRKLRAKLAPIFTSGKLKQMYQFFSEVSNEMINTCEINLKQSNVLEIRDIMSRYTVDTISSVVYGLETSSLKNPKSEFHHNGKKALITNRLNLLLAIFTPEILEKITLPFYTSNSMRDFFVNTFKDMIDYRHKEKLIRKDFLNLLMQLMDRGVVEDDERKTTNESEDNLEKLNTIEAAAQAFVFFIAGYEAASLTTSYALLELALNPEIQDKLRKEIDQMEKTTGITYENVMENEYLDMTLSETSRKYPTLGVINRICGEDFPIPNSNYTIPKGMRVIISISGVHRNSEFYPDPEKFDPMRFSKENAAKSSPYVFLAFGEGPRYCIGKRFAQLQTKLAVVTMLRNYKFYVSEKTQFPVTFATDTFAQSPKYGIYLRLEKRKH